MEGNECGPIHDASLQKRLGESECGEVDPNHRFDIHNRSISSRHLRYHCRTVIHTSIVMQPSTSSFACRRSGVAYYAMRLLWLLFFATPVVVSAQVVQLFPF